MRYLYTMLFFCLTQISYGQNEDSLKLEDLKAPTSPGFSLLDLSPTSVERPTSPKQIGLNLLNFVSSDNALPKNFAIEFAPFWLTKHRGETIFKYLSLKDTSGSRNFFLALRENSVFPSPLILMILAKTLCRKRVMHPLAQDRIYSPFGEQRGNYK